MPLKISFGMIVLNGEPFLLYNLRALYPFAHQIIVAEGASINASKSATDSGHSKDKTLEILGKFKKFEDPEDKLIIITAEHCGYANGFWPGEKEEQSSAYAERATGDYLWQVDVDEFYKEEDIEKIINLLFADPTITAVTFPEISFWGSFDFYCDGPYLRLSYSRFHRLFKWGPGYKMISHRPPTVVNDEGIDVREINWVNSEDLKKKGIFLYHYCQIFNDQIKNKMLYYDSLIKTTNRAKRIIKIDTWWKESFITLHDPFHVHTVNTQPSWLVRFKGKHPLVIQQLKRDIDSGYIAVDMRKMDDVNQILASPSFILTVNFIKLRANYVTQTVDLFKSMLRKRISFPDGIKFLWAIILGKQKVF